MPSKLEDAELKLREAADALEQVPVAAMGFTLLLINPKSLRSMADHIAAMIEANK
jgi:hypothetical protein